MLTLHFFTESQISIFMKTLNIRFFKYWTFFIGRKVRLGLNVALQGKKLLRTSNLGWQQKPWLWLKVLHASQTKGVPLLRNTLHEMTSSNRAATKEENNLLVPLDSKEIRTHASCTSGSWADYKSFPIRIGACELNTRHMGQGLEWEALPAWSVRTTAFVTQVSCVWA